MVMADPDYDLSPKEVRQAVAAVLRRPQAEEAGEPTGQQASGTVPQAQRLPGTAVEANAITPKLKDYSHAEPLVYLGKNPRTARAERRRAPVLLGGVYADGTIT